MTPEIDELLHDADRAVGGISMAQMMGDIVSAAYLTNKAKALYEQALALDSDMKDAAWREAGNREPEWLRRHGFAKIAELSR